MTGEDGYDHKALRVAEVLLHSLVKDLRRPRQHEPFSLTTLRISQPQELRGVREHPCYLLRQHQCPPSKSVHIMSKMIIRMGGM